MVHRRVRITLLATLSALLGFGSLAEARGHHGHHGRRAHHGHAPAAAQADDADEDEDTDADEGSDDDSDDSAAAQADDGDVDDDGDVGLAAPPSMPNAAGRTFGIFVGISHYGGDNEDLPGSAEDAARIARAFREHAWADRAGSVVLTDAAATASNVRQAFRRVAAQATAADTVVFFFDGHGNSQEIDLRGPDLSRAELGRMMNAVHGRQLLVLDSCEAGGFAPLVQGRADRAGLFSSRANESSSTAPDVNSGGWLAYAFGQAVSGAVPPRPDGSLDMQAVVRHVQQTYREHDVTSDQHLVATLGDSWRREGLGGHPGAADVAVASREPAVDDGDDAPVTSRPRAPGRVTTPFGALPTGWGISEQQVDQVFGLGTQMAGQVLQALVK